MMRFLRRHHLLSRTLLILLACWSGQAAALPKTDVITLINGDVVTCEIKEMVRGKVRAKTDHIGTISIKWDKIARLDSKYWFLVTLRDGSLVYGQLPDSGEDGVLVVSFQEKETTLPMRQVIEIEPVRYDLWDRFDISASLGINWTKASDVLTSNFDASTKYNGRLYSWGLDISSIITDKGEGDVTRRNELGIYLQREISGKLNWTVDTGTYRNDELGVRMRVNLGANLGYYFFRTSHIELKALGGANVNREWASLDADPANNAEGRVGTNFIIFYHDSPKTDLTVKADLYPGLTDTDRARFEGSISGRQEIVKDLFVKVEYYESRDNKPPAGAHSKEDRGIVFAIEWTK
ncbi:MAG: DUF481 domain-containing protein [Candidatus Krumholzibacteria bacterium]|nr:DUF481 domain-containing protein [Candidatus Krumholzibacteria bacterium]